MNNILHDFHSHNFIMWFESSGVKFWILQAEEATGASKFYKAIEASEGFRKARKPVGGAGANGQIDEENG